MESCWQINGETVELQVLIDLSKLVEMQIETCSEYIIWCIVNDFQTMLQSQNCVDKGSTHSKNLN